MEKIIFLDYETLQILWWLFLGVILIGFAVMGGSDLGVAALLRWAGRNDSQHRIIINTIAPVWEGNQVWLILGVGAILAAFPPLYAVAFSSFYGPLLLILIALVVRPVAIKYRSKNDDRRWRSAWDWALVIGGVIPPFLIGVALGNVLIGLPFYFDEDLRSFFEGSALGLLSPFAMLCGILALSMTLMHGAVYLALKTDGEIQARARHATVAAALLSIALFTVAGLWTAFGMDGYVLTRSGALVGVDGLIDTTVERETGAWLSNYGTLWPILIPLVAYAGALSTIAAALRRRFAVAWATSAASVAGVIGTFGAATFPFILPSSIDPGASLTIWNSSSSHLALFLLFLVTIVLLPIVIAYTTWVFRIMRGKIDEEFIKGDSAY
jgi:cytochrome d ubiquinol oxidase subunit II